MYKKVIVLELKTAYALVMEEGGTILRIYRKDGLAVGDTIYVLPEDIYQEKRASAVIPFPAGGKGSSSGRKHSGRSVWLRLSGMVAMLALCISLFLPQFSVTAYAVASFDGDSSIQVELDQDGRILSAVSLDGSVTQDDLDSLKGKTIEDAAIDLNTWCGDGSILIGYALMDGSEGDSATLQSIQALFTKQPVVCLSGVAGDVHAADEQSVSLGRYLMSQMKTDDLDDILEELPPETIEQMLKENPAWSSHPEFQEALEERREKQDEEREGTADPDDELDVPSDETEEEPEDNAPSVNGGEDREPDESPTAPSDNEDGSDQNEPAEDSDEDTSSSEHSSDKEQTTDVETDEQTAGEAEEESPEQSGSESGTDASEDTEKEAITSNQNDNESNEEDSASESDTESDTK